MSDAGKSKADKVIVFDGVCVLCNHWIGFVLANDRREEFSFAAMQSQAGRALLQQHGLDPDSPASFLLLDGCQWLTDSDAIVSLLRHFSWPWRVMSMVIAIVPRRWRDVVYRCIARNRYRWFGRFDTCSIPTPQNAHRFLR